MDKIINEYLVKINEKPKINTIEKSKKNFKRKKRKGGPLSNPGYGGYTPII